MLDCPTEYLNVTELDTIRLEDVSARTQAVDPLEIWRINCSPALTGESASYRFDCLSPSERERAARLRFPRQSHQFAAAHAALRYLLGTRLGCPPRIISLLKDEQGKPHVEGRPLFFSLSHSDSLALVALGADVEVGVDVERIRALPDLEALIAFACTRTEQAELAQAGDTAARARLFLSFWTRKEAALKATGRGLRVSPRLIETSRGPWVVPDPVGAPNTRVHVTSLPWNDAVGAVGAVASLGVAQTLVMKDFDWDQAEISAAA